MALLLFGGLCGVAIALIILSDKLLKIQHQEFKSDWENDGKPRGFFYKPDGSSLTSFWKLSYADVDTQYRWIKNHSEASKLFSILKPLSKLCFWYCLFIVPLIVLTKLFGL
jgi:hypothetical protein